MNGNGERTKLDTEEGKEMLYKLLVEHRLMANLSNSTSIPRLHAVKTKEGLGYKLCDALGERLPMQRSF